VRRLPPKEVKILDDLCRRLIFLRDRNTCQKCGKRERLQWCHVTTRGIHSLRWVPENSLILCAGHHLWWHREPLAAVSWWKDKYPKRAERVNLLRCQIRPKLDKVAMRLWLETEIAKREGP
jgi:hypothetical protein